MYKCAFVKDEFKPWLVLHLDISRKTKRKVLA